MKDLVSVVVPIYNSEKQLNRCIDSIINQTYHNIKIILVDDGSTDNSLSICKKYAKNDNRIKVIHKKNGGVSSARNAGIKVASGKYITFIDSDDYIDKDYIDVLVNNSGKKNELINSNFMVVSKNGKKSVEKCKYLYSKDDFIEAVINGQIMGTSCTHLFDLSVAKQLLFDETTYYMEDTIFLFNYLNLASIKTIRYVDCYYYYAYSENSITRSNVDVLDRCQKIFYSIDCINKLTNNKYILLIEDKKNRMLENHLHLLNSKELLNEAMEKIKLPKYNGTNFIYKIFNYLYFNKHTYLLLFYYFVRNIFINTKRFIRKYI